LATVLLALPFPDLLTEAGGISYVELFFKNIIIIIPGAIGFFLRLLMREFCCFTSAFSTVGFDTEANSIFIFFSLAGGAESTN
jgi:hypothetical protein